MGPPNTARQSRREKGRSLAPSPHTSRSLGIILAETLTVKGKTRFVILTHEAIHWFKRNESEELFGEERGTIDLSQITKLIPMEQRSTFEVSTVEHEHISFETEGPQQMLKWQRSINLAMLEQEGAQGRPERRHTLTGIDFLGVGKSYIQSVSIADNEDRRRGFLRGNPRGLVERLIARQVPWGKTFKTPPISPSQDLLVTMSHGGIARISFDQLKSTRRVERRTEVSRKGASVASNLIFDTRSASWVTNRSRVKDLSFPIDIDSMRTHIWVLLLAAFVCFSTAPLVAAPLGECVRLDSKGAMAVEVSTSHGSTQSTAHVLVDEVVIEDMYLGGGSSVSSHQPCIGHASSCVDFSGEVEWPGIARTVECMTRGEAFILSGAWLTGVLACASVILVAVATTPFSIFSESFVISFMDEELQFDEIPAVPQKFIEGCFGDMQEATRRWKLTYTWRRKNNIDNILDEPQPHFDVIKKYYPHFWCNRARNGSICYYEVVGQININGLVAAGVTIDNMVRYYTFMTEYMWRRMCPEEDGPKSKAVTIFDINGIKLSDVAGDALKFLKAASKICGDHYPERSQNICIINVPSFFSLIWRLVKSFIPEATLQKVRIGRPGQETLEALTSLIDIDNIPVEYGGNYSASDARWSCRDSQAEVDFRRFVSELNDKHKTRAGREAAAKDE